MNDIIADILAKKLAGLGFVSKAAGLVYDLKTKSKGIDKIFPAATKVYINSEACSDESVYKDLIPNSKDTGILYFEDLDSDLVYKTDVYEQWKGSLKLVGWFNVLDVCQKINLFHSIHDINCLIKNVIEEGLSDTDAIFESSIGITKHYSKRRNPFLRFSYDETQTQYLIHPFDFFSFKVDYTVFAKCNCRLQYDVTVGEQVIESGTTDYTDFVQMYIEAKTDSNKTYHP